MKHLRFLFVFIVVFVFSQSVTWIFEVSTAYALTELRGNATPLGGAFFDFSANESISSANTPTPGNCFLPSGSTYIKYWQPGTGSYPMTGILSFASFGGYNWTSFNNFNMESSSEFSTDGNYYIAFQTEVAGTLSCPNSTTSSEIVYINLIRSGGVWSNSDITPTCSDGIQNQDEMDIDVGGACQVYSSFHADTFEQIGSSFNHLIQTLGTNLTGTLTRIDIKTSNASALFYGSRSWLSLYECDDDTYGSVTFNGSNCTLLYSGLSDDSSKLEASIQSFYTNPIVLNPSKYYFFTSQGNNIFNVLPVYYGSTEDTVDGSCYQYRLSTSITIAPCVTVSDLYFRFYGVEKVVAPPSPTGCTVDCFSNVLFLPGIKGSVLKKGNFDTLWPPTIFNFNDVSQLALTNEGESVNDIRTDGILNTFHITPIYAPFSNFLDGLVTGGTIDEWLPLAYDWRFLPEKILQDGIKTTNETVDVMEKIKTLAGNSKTRKVAIVAHSMGGLLGKAIIKKLEDEGKSNLVESFVMVGSPQLGTPQAIGAILHGDNEGIVVGLIAHPADMRAIAQNMPSAYNLLPSPRYFTEVLDPVIKFDPDASFTQAWRDFWGTTINTYSNFLSFMTGMGVTRTKPVENILRDPEVLRPELMAEASSFHNQYDNYQLPEHIRVVQVAGWGIPTTKAVEYKTSHGIPSYKTLFTVEGDKTVVYPSAISSVADEMYFFNMIDYNKALNSNVQHRDLLNTNTLQGLIQSVIKKEDVANIDFLSTTKPLITNLDDQLIVSTHSPVILGAYDQLGNFTGIDLNQDLSADILSISENIPSSTFLYTSESQYIFLPKEGTYNFVYKGIGNGPTTVAVENFTADVATPVVSYTDIPTTSNTTATFTVQSATPEDAEIALDVNGDGTVDDIISADGTELSLNELLIIIKEKISTLSIKDKLKQNLLKRIFSLEKNIENKKQKNAKILANLQKKISKQEIKISTVDATGITSLLDILEAQAENIALDSVTLNSLKNKIQSLNIKNNLKNDLLKRVEKLEKKQVLIKTLSNLSKNITKKAEKGKISDQDAQDIIDLLNKIEDMI